MGRNVLLLYMSIFNKNPKIQTQTQTNEGAVRYLIEEGETPDCILALCSERVRKEAKEMPDGSTRTTLEYFRDSFLPKVHIPAERLAGQHGRRNTVSGYLAAAGKDRDRGHPFC